MNTLESALQGYGFFFCFGNTRFQPFDLFISSVSVLCGDDVSDDILNDFFDLFKFFA